MRTGRPLSDPVPRFWGAVDKRGPDECWPWTKSLTHDGYGRFWMKCDGVYGCHIAHRVAWEFVHGRVPEGLYVCHTCDRPSCCNTRHHFLGTMLANHQDKCRKQRQARGETQGSAKLSEEQVLAIRATYQPGTPYWRLAETYGVAANTIANIVKGKTWKHLKAA